MKRFHELTKEQKKTALAYARKVVIEASRDPNILVEHSEDPNELCLMVAENTWYSEREDHVVADIADGK